MKSPLRGKQSPHSEVEYRLTTTLARIAEIARAQPTIRFTSLAHLIDIEMLKQCHDEQKVKRAAGVDGVTKAEYDRNLETHLVNLHQRLRNQAYKPQPVRRTYIPKPGSDKRRPLGIPAYEDKLVQSAISKILTAIFEADFLDTSYGFRPQRGAHDALKTLNHLFITKKINYVVDADIMGFFDHVDHQWLMKFLGHRIADKTLLRLIYRFLKAGIMEEGAWRESGSGTPQGGLVSPILANLYLHYSLDLWFEKSVRKQCVGKAYMIRYADDFVCCFQYQQDAVRFHAALQKRLGKFALTIAEDKTKIVEFGRFAKQHCAPPSKPATFDFLGFTHYCGESYQGKFRVKRRTSQKKFRASLERMKIWIRENRTRPAAELMHELTRKLQGYYQFYGITDNGPRLYEFFYHVKWALFKWLNRRGQRKSFDAVKFNLFLAKFPLPAPKIHVNIMDFRVSPAYFRE